MRQIVPNYESRRDRMKLLAQHVTESPNRSFEETQAQKREAASPANTEPLSSPDSSFNGTPSPNRESTGMGERLASLFSSRAVIKANGQAQASSPAGSEASSGYVGWPGTQDRRGDTVAMRPGSDVGQAAVVRDYDTSQMVQNGRFEDSDSSEGGHSPNYRLTEAVVNAASAAASPMARRGQAPSDYEKVHRLAKPQVLFADPWGKNHSDETMSVLSTAFSETSSAYFNPNDNMNRGKINRVQEFGKKKKVAAAVMRSKVTTQKLTEEALRQRDHYAPPHRTFNSNNAAGYQGLLDKTKDIPNLMDDTSSVATRETSMSETPVQPRTRQQRAPMQVQDQIKEDEEFVYTDPYKQTGGNFNVVLLGGGLTTIQTTANDFTNRKTASDYDDNLTNSDIDDNGYAKIPGFHEMVYRGTHNHDQSLDAQSAVLFSEYTVTARDAIERFRSNSLNRTQNHINGFKKESSNENDSAGSSSSLFSDPYKKEGYGVESGNLDRYYIHPDEMKKVAKKFRKMSSLRSHKLSHDEFDREEDAMKAFALSEMRSRIMEKDIERGLERRGGTTVVDDTVLTPYNKAALRVRDAVTVAKAWRDGATPLDVINTSILTQRAERSYFIPRLLSTGSRRSPEYKYAWEEVLWFDDLELSQYRSQSLGPRSMRGYEIFTISDCQSMLLKLCNERCLELKRELNNATTRLIDAEDMMREEGDDDGMMTESEMRYLSSMEEVKTISHQLVLAEKSFTLVKDRIERLVAKFEALLVKLDNDTGSIAASSIVSYQSSYVSDWTAAEEREREQLARRAQRAELKAEVAVRENLLARPEARAVRTERENELKNLKMRLAELQSETSAAITEREHSVVLARAITANKPSKAKNTSKISKSKIDDVKQRFRNRSAAKLKTSPSDVKSVSSAGARSVTFQKRPKPVDKQRRNVYRAVGEEMYQQLDFYERSLQAVSNH